MDDEKMIIGDEVAFHWDDGRPDTVIVITHIGYDGFIDGMDAKGTLYASKNPQKWTKTGRCFPLVNQLLRQMRAATNTDTISRQAAIDFIDAGHLCNPNEPRWSDNEIVNFLKSRPSAEPKWIPCSERLPKYDETSEYLVTDKDRRIRHCYLVPFMSRPFVTVEEGMTVDAVAWWQVPEPYKERT